MRKYIEASLIDIKISFKYRLNLFLNSTMLILPLLGYTFLFRILYTSGVSLENYSLRTIFTYYFWSLLAYNTMPVYAYGDITHNIKSGVLSYFLTRPMNFLLYYYSAISGAALIWVLTNGIVLIPFLYFFRTLFVVPNILDGMIGILFFLLGFVLAVLSGFILQLTSFFVGDPYGYREIYGWVLAIFGGSIIPLDLLPRVFLHLPFKYFYYIPAKAFMGELTHIPLLFIEVVLWIIFFWGVTMLIWRKGLKKYEAFGG